MFADAQIIKQGSNYVVQHGTDNNLFVTFFMEAVHDEEESAKQGRPIYHDREFVKIIPVGDTKTIVCRPVDKIGTQSTPPDHIRWPRQYEAFKNQQTQTVEGTPLEHWAPLSKSQVLMYKSANVHTVEQLASVSDTNLANLGMGARESREKAIAYLQNAKDNAGITSLQMENETLKSEIAALKNQMEALLLSLKTIKDDGTDDESAPRRGRPPKQVE